jgi:hypothetical protein
MSDNFDAARAPVTWAGRPPAGGGRARRPGRVLGLVPADYPGRPANWWITALSATHRRAVTGARLPAPRTMHRAHGPRPGSAARQRDFSERGGLGGSSGWPAGKPTTGTGLPADPEKA